MKKPIDFSRRRFLGSTALFSGAAMGFSHFPLAASDLSSQPLPPYGQVQIQS